MLPAFDVPAWALRGLILTVALGFVPALIFQLGLRANTPGLEARRRRGARAIDHAANRSAHGARIRTEDNFEMKIDNFFAELKRRNVYKVAVAYAVVAWLFIQAASILFPTFEAPPWVMKIFVAVILLGFLAVLILSWAFEITPEGIKLESEVAPNESVTRRTGRRIVGMTVVLAMIAAGLFVFQYVRSKSTTSVTTVLPAVTAKSIAVLPFENRSEDKANAYFADGIQDEILTRLSKIADLKVISQHIDPALQKRARKLDPRSRSNLGVANIVEGSVQKSGDAVRVNVQLINAANDSHLWAETFDRKLTDIFSVESEVAKAIADQLRAKLTGRGRASHCRSDRQTILMLTMPTCAVWLIILKTANSPANSLGAQKYLRGAVRLDPKFALAWALLSFVEGRGYLTQTLQPTVSTT